MNEKFKRIRDMQMFDVRERTFLKDLKKRINESYQCNI